MKCEICGADPSKSNVAIYRVNRRREKGIWRCEKHMTPKQKMELDTETKKLVDIIKEGILNDGKGGENDKETDISTNG